MLRPAISAAQKRAAPSLALRRHERAFASIDRRLAPALRSSARRPRMFCYPTPPKGIPMKTKAFALLAVLLVSTFPATEARATVLRVVVVQTENMEGYMKELERGQAILKKAGSVQTLRVWRARYAGADAGSIVVSIEFPDLVTMAADEKKLNDNAEFQTWIKALGKMRKIVSDSLYDELPVAPTRT
jgi:hypothetical protein